MLKEVRRAGAGLDHAAVRRQISPQDGQRAFGVNRLGQRPYHILVVDLGALNVVAHAAAGHRHGTQIQMLAQHVHHGAHTAGKVKVFHQVLVAAGPDIGNDRHLAAGRIKVFKTHGAVLAGAARHRHQVNDGVGRATHGHRHSDGVFKRGAIEHFGRCQVFPDHVHNAPAAICAHAHMVGVGGRNRGGTGQREAAGLGNACHGAGRAHGHAMAVAAGNTALHFDPLLGRDLAGAPLVPVFPGVRTRAQDLALPVAALHGPGWHVDEGIARAQRTHDQARRCLVTAAHQHRAINRVAAQQLLGLNGQQVAVKHGGGLDDGLGQRDRRQLDRETTRLQNAALDVFDALLEVTVAGADIAPGVDDGDHGFAHPVIGAVAQLHHARAVTKRAQVVRRHPARTAQFVVGFACHRFFLNFE